MKTATRIPPVSGWSVDEVISSTGLSRQTVYNEINSGRLASFKVGRRRLISPAALARWVKTLEGGAA